LSVVSPGFPPHDVAQTVPKGKVVYCHCAAGRRSLEAVDILKNFGYDVRALKPGYRDLIKAGFESDRN
jgi:rhodanese-related sulfurtransferase